MIETIKIDFPAEMENKTWEKRELHEIVCTSRSSVLQKDSTNRSPEKICCKSTKEPTHAEMTEGLSKFIADVNTRVDEYRKSGAKELRKQLDDDYRKLCATFKLCENSQIMACIQRIDSILHENTKNLKGVKKQARQKSIGTTDREIQMQKRLSEIKSLIKNNLSQPELHKINNELLVYKNELTDNVSVFSKAYNTPSKISQIENYLSKVAKKIAINSNLIGEKEAIIQNSNENAQNANTKRDIKIQEELVSLRDEVKREAPRETKNESPKKQKMQVIWKFEL